MSVAAKRSRRLLCSKKTEREIAEDIAYLREVLNYDPETGVITRKKKTSRKVRVGDICGHPTSNGYLRFSVGSTELRAHVVAYALVHGRVPQGQIDHINGERQDNRINNLRDVSRSINQQNLKRPKSGNQSGYLGVTKITRGANTYYVSEIGLNRKYRYLGCFSCPEEAHARYLQEKRKIHAGNTL